jgi:hypothetical protein
MGASCDKTCALELNHACFVAGAGLFRPRQYQGPTLRGDALKATPLSLADPAALEGLQEEGLLTDD